MKQKRAYHYHCYPTAEQKHMLAQTFGCARFVYNWALRLRTDAYYQQQKRVSYADTSALLTSLKQRPEYAWLNDVSCVPTQQALRHLDRAFRNFFEGRAAYPKFHSKHGEQSAEYTTSAFKWDGKQLTLAKMDTPLALVWSRPLPKGCKPTTVTVTKDTAGRYFVSILVEEDIQPLPVVNKQVGLDLGLTSMVILSTGEQVGNPRYFAKDEKKLAKAQRRLAKKKKGSKNRAKARLKVARRPGYERCQKCVGRGARGVSLRRGCKTWTGTCLFRQDSVNQENSSVRVGISLRLRMGRMSSYDNDMHMVISSIDATLGNSSRAC